MKNMRPPTLPDEAFKPSEEEARREIAQYKALRELLKENSFGCEIHIGPMQMGICENEKLIPVINSNIEEIEKFLNGVPNAWE